MCCIVSVPSGKQTHNYGKSPCYSWENSLFLWSFSIAMLVISRGYPYHLMVKLRNPHGNPQVFCVPWLFPFSFPTIHQPWRPSVIDRGGQLSRRANAAHHVGHGVGPAEGQPGPGDGWQDAQGTPQVADI